MRPRLNWCLSFLGIALIGCGKTPTPAAAESSPTTTSGQVATSGAPLKKLEIKDIKTGKGAVAKDGDSLGVTYTGKLKDGSVFDSNDKPGGEPFRFMLGAGSVIKGWDQGMAGMKVGGERELSIPSDLGYGNQAQGGKIPAGSDLYFDVKLTSLTNPQEAATITSNDKKKGTGPELKVGDMAVINYTMTSDDGALDDDKHAKTPYTFKLGAGQVLPAIDFGVRGMRVGGERVLTIPQMYGPHNPAFMKSSSFTADIKLLSIKTAH
jgi:FKBP-type peptidyl-prolyl cis-trans isomerase